MLYFVNRFFNIFENFFAFSLNYLDLNSLNKNPKISRNFWKNLDLFRKFLENFFSLKKQCKKIPALVDAVASVICYNIQPRQQYPTNYKKGNNCYKFRKGKFFHFDDLPRLLIKL